MGRWSTYHPVCVDQCVSSWFLSSLYAVCTLNWGSPSVASAPSSSCRPLVMPLRHFKHKNMHIYINSVSCACMMWHDVEKCHKTEIYISAGNTAYTHIWNTDNGADHISAGWCTVVDIAYTIRSKPTGRIVGVTWITGVVLYTISTHSDKPATSFPHSTTLHST